MDKHSPFKTVALDVLAQADACYAGLDHFRRERERNKRYHYGDQWGDLVRVGGQMVTEEQFIRDQGSEPLKNNLIRRLVRNVIGVYTMQGYAPQCVARDPARQAEAAMLSARLRANADLNRLEALYVRTLEDFLIGGMAVHRKWYGRRGLVADCWTEYVQPNAFFVDSAMRDFRGWDCTCLGQIHDVAFDQLCGQFARSEADCRALEDIYGDASDLNACASAWDEFGAPRPGRSFLMPTRPGLCRVYEVWRRETRRRQRPAWGIEECWRYYFLTPTGRVLATGDSPYAHGLHPYVVKAYPMIDGEIHSFVADVIDQQRYANRLITMYDWLMRSSAKGVLLIPDDCVPRGTSVRDFADTWSKFNGVMVYHPSACGETPKQVSNNCTNIGIIDLLNIQLQFFEDISGVNGALEGKLANSAMSAELFGQQTQNATSALQDVLGTFREFVRDAAYKDASMLQQFGGAPDIEFDIRMHSPQQAVPHNPKR